MGPLCPKIVVFQQRPEVQALIQEQNYHNFAEKMIGQNHGPLAEELANEDDESPEVQAMIHDQNEVRYEVL